jgi:hypothetical protein
VSRYREQARYAPDPMTRIRPNADLAVETVAGPVGALVRVSAHDAAG